MQTASGFAAAAFLAAGILGACGDSARVDPAPPADAASRADGAVPARGELVASEKTIPVEPGDQFADIATSPDAVDQAWRRFGLTGPAPQIDFTTDALLFAGFGESGSCPARFDGLTVTGARVDIGLGNPSEATVCTSDYNPRTLVIRTAREALPDAGFQLIFDGASFPLAATPVAQPPRGPLVVRTLTAEQPRVDLVARKDAGGDDRPAVQLVLSNHGDVSASTGGWPMTLLRWNEQRWLPAVGQTEYNDHPAISAEPVEVEPGSTKVIADIDREALQPAWYSVVAKLQFGGRGGAAVVQAVFDISP